MTAEDENVLLIAENAALREQVTALVHRVQELEARLAKDSHNSSKPPASDGLRRKTKSLRKPSGKKPGGQLGHRSQTLHLVATPDVVVEHRPLLCTHCQAPLPDDAPVVLRERRQVHELPPVRLLVHDHQAAHVRCPACQQVSVGTFPAEAPSRVQYGPRMRAGRLSGPGAVRPLRAGAATASGPGRGEAGARQHSGLGTAGGTHP